METSIFLYPSPNNPKNIKISPSDKKAYDLHNEIFSQPIKSESQIQKVEDAYQQALKEEPTSETYTNYAQFLFETRQIDRAMQYLHLAKKENEQYAPTWIMLALVYLQKYELINAEKAIYVASELDPSNAIIPEIWTEILISQTQNSLHLLNIPQARDFLFKAKEMKNLAEKMTNDESIQKYLQTTYAKIEQVFLAIENGFLPYNENIFSMLTAENTINFTPSSRAANDNVSPHKSSDTDQNTA